MIIKNLGKQSKWLLVITFAHKIIIPDDNRIVKTFNDFFSTAVKDLNVNFLTNVGNIDNTIKTHPYIKEYIPPFPWRI